MPGVEERLAASDSGRAKMIRRFGFMPLSVVEIPRGRIHHKLRHYVHERGHRQQPSVQELTKSKGPMSAASVRRCKPSSAGGNINAFSMMPGEVVEFFIRYYGQPGDLYYDPFAGQGIQGQVAKLMGLHYVGQDVCAAFCEFMRACFAELDDGTTRLEIHEQTSERAVLGDNEADFSFTSPPYWDLEEYDDAADQLGRGKTYADFLAGLGRVAAEHLRVMKPGARAVVNVNDFRRDKRFYAYHADTIALYQQAGWLLDDLWILSGGVLTGLARVFALRHNNLRHAPKMHEYGLVFIKP